MCWFPPGEDNNIYCKFCYHRKFAPVGYRQYTYPDLIIITPVLLSGTILSFQRVSSQKSSFTSGGRAVPTGWTGSQTMCFATHSRHSTFSLHPLHLNWTELIVFVFRHSECKNLLGSILQAKTRTKSVHDVHICHNIPSTQYVLLCFLSSNFDVFSSSLKKSVVSVYIYQLLPL